MKNRKPLVSVSCITCNHSSYITKTLENFIKQNTTFNFEILIHDDASTDDTVKIIKYFQRKYPNLIFPIFQKINQYSQGISPTFVFNLPRARGKYIALCEGDDYWTDPYKLQKQVDFMETNPECSFCFHASEKIKNGKPSGVTRANSGDTIFYKNNISKIATSYARTASLLFKKELVKNIPQWVLNAPVGDVPLKLILMTRGNAGYLDENMSSYRVNTANSYTRMMENNKKKFARIKKNKAKMWSDFNKYSDYKYNEQVIPQQLAANMQSLIGKSFFKRLKFYFSDAIQKPLLSLSLPSRIKVVFLSLILLIFPDINRKFNLKYTQIYQRFIFR
ncbi:MAG: glycosyltransferase [Patescibacteria group bacterium]|nr:glycosyltransferase [Patescibacteria group bacterium]